MDVRTRIARLIVRRNSRFNFINIHTDDRGTVIAFRGERLHSGVKRNKRRREHAIGVDIDAPPRTRNRLTYGELCVIVFHLAHRKKPR